MTLKSYWREDGVSPIISEDELIKRLSSRKSGVVFLSTVPSSNGETRIVQALAREKEAKEFYCRELIEELIKIILNNPHNCLATDELCAQLTEYPIIIVRFANWLVGLSSTMESLSQICSKLSNKNLIMVTGDYLDRYVPELLQQLPQAEKYYICY